jgi:hypothetical protein
MRYWLHETKWSYTVTKAPEPRTEFGSGKQKVDRQSGRPEWVVEVLAQDAERGEVIKVTVTGDQPKVNQGQPVRFKRAILHPMQHSACYALPECDGFLWPPAGLSEFVLRSPRACLAAPMSGP